DITNNGTLNWSGGNMPSVSGKTIFNYGTFNIPAANAIFGLNVVNKSGGTVNRTGIGNQTIPTVFTNEAGATLNVLSGATLTFTDSLHNSGTVDVPGVLALSGGSHRFEGGTFGGTGFLNFNGATTITSTTGFVPAFDTINLNNTATISGGPNTAMTLPAATTFIATNTNTINGFTVITNNGKMEFIQNIGSTVNHTVESDITNNGTLNWSGGNMLSASGKTIFNYGAFNISAALYTFTLNVVNKSGGTVNRTGSNNQIIPTVFTNEAGATLNVLPGATLTFTDSLHNSGTVDVPGTLALQGGSHRFEGGTFGGTGFLNFNGTTTITSSTGFVPAFDTINLPISATISGGPNTAMTLPAATTFIVNNTNTINGFTGITNNGTLAFIQTLSGIYNHTIESDITNNGILNWSGGNMLSASGKTIFNYGAFNISAALYTFTLNVVNKSGGTVNRTTANNQTLSGAFTNETGGTVNITNGTLTLAAAGTHGGAFLVNTGTTLSFANTTTNSQITGATFSNNGTVSVGIGRFVVFSGSAAQTLSGNGSFASLAVNNPAHLSIPGAQTLTNLNLLDGNILLGNSDLVVTNFTGGGASSFVATTGTGRLQSGTSTTAKLFHIGPSATQYNPVTLRNVSGTSTFAVRVQVGLDNPISDPAKVDRQWNIDRIAGTAGADVSLHWTSPGDESPALDLSNIHISRWDGAMWQNFTSGPATCSGLCSRTATGVTTFSPFTIAGAALCNISISSIAVTHETCPNANDGTLMITANCLSCQNGNADIQYAVNGGAFQSSNVFTGLSDGNYTVAVRDVNEQSCQDSDVATITQPTALMPSTTQVNVSCNGGSNGSIDLTVSGGTPPYTYAWGLGPITQDRTNLPAGTYTVTITDANGCSATTNATITQPTALIPSTTQVNVSCNGGSNGSIDLTVFGGMPPYTYDWGLGLTTQDRTNLPAGTYTVTITDANGCSATASQVVTVADNQPPTITCPTGSPLTRNTDAGACTYAVQGTEFDPTAFGDNCPGATITNDFNNSATLANAVLPNGSATITWTVTDGSNQATCQITVNVLENQSPTITCPTGSPFALNTDAGACTYTVQNTEFDPTAFGDNCPGAMITNSFNNTVTLANADLPNGSMTITWTVTDGFNQTTCQITVEVTDNQPPIITCPAGSPIARNADPNSCQYTLQGTEFNPTASGDNCPGATITNDFNNSATLAGAVLPGGSNTITWTVTDAALLSTTCQITVDVRFPEISVFGNSIAIADGDATPDAGDHTDFGTVPECSGSVARTFTIQNTGNANLSVGTPVIGGTHAADFSVTALPAGTVTPGGNTTFQITFDPTATGLRSATITFPNGDCDGNPFNFAVQGLGTGPEIEVSGNNTGIADGAGSPNTTNHTDFGSTTACTGSIVRTFTIQNTGNTDLTVGTPVIAGTHAADFMVTAFPTSPVVPGGNTTFQITFTPSGDYLHTATVSFANGDCLENPYNFAIQGTRGGPKAGISGNNNTIADGDAGPGFADHTDFGSMPECTGTIVRTFTIQNTGNANLTVGTPVIGGAQASDFTLTSPPASSVAPGSSTTFQITFDPSAIGLRSATVSVAVNDCDIADYNFSIQGTGTYPEMDVFGNSAPINNGDATPGLADHTDFGGTATCTGTVVRTFTIENNGIGDLNIGAPTLSGTHAAEFTVTAAPASPVAPGFNTTFQITFSPSEAGLRSATVTLTNNDCDENPYTFAVQGTGNGAEIAVEGNGVNIADNDNTPDAGDHTDFGSMSACSGSIARTFTIRNIGNQPLTIGVPVIGGTAAADFTLTNAPASPVAAGSSTTFEVTFNPSVIGLRSATLSISNSDCNEDPFNFSIQGTGADPEIDIRGNGNSITDGDATPSTTDRTDFGNVVVNSSLARTFVVHNTGNTNLSVNSIAGDNPRFLVSGLNPGSVISPGQSASFTVTFNPTANGAQNATITVLNDDCDESIYTFAVTGYGCSLSTFTACPAPISVNVNPGQCVASVNYVAMATGDPAPVLNYQFSGATAGSGGGAGSGSIFNKGVTNVVVSAVNTCGTTPTCAFTITVADNQSPTITCPTGSPIARSAGLNECQYAVQGTEFDPAAAADNCPGSTVTNSFNNSATLAGATLQEGPTTITWTITDAALQTATCQIEINVSLPLAAKMTVRGNSQPIANNDNTPDAGDHTDFGAEPACLSPIVRTFIIQNTGGADLNLGPIMITGANPGDFSVTGQPTNPVPANSSSTLEITFTPQAGGLRSASVSFTNNDCYTPDFRFDIKGTGFGPEMELEGNFTGIADGHTTPNYTDYTDFGGVRACSGTFTRTFTIRNLSGAGLNPGAISITGPGAGDFVVTAPPAGTVSVGSSTTFQITFDPSAVGVREAAVSIANNDCLENPYDFAIQGTGTDPVLAVSGNNLTIENGDASPAKTDHTDFGQVYLGGNQARTRTFTIQNAGTGSLHITGISSDNPLFEVGALTPSGPIPGNGTATVDVTFRPTTVSEQSATITISSNNCNTATFTFRVKGVTPVLTDNVVDCRTVDNPLVDGELFINYGSVVDAYSIKNRSSYTVGEPAIGSSISPDNILYMGYWGRFLAPSLAPDVEATEGDLQDRILVKWYVNELGAAATEGFNVYRDSAFLAYAGKNVRSFNDFNVIAGKPYNYEVRGVNPYGEGSGGKAIGFMVPNGTVTGWVQTLSGRPVPEVLVTLTPSLGFSAKFEMDDEAFAKADTGTAENFLPETSNGEWTIAFWVKTDNAQANAAIIGLEPFPLYFRPIGSAGGHEGIEIAQTATGAAILSHQFPDSTKNGWHHIALSRDGDDTGRLYVDGVLTNIGTLPPIPEANELLLGARTEAPGTWAGYLDELRIYHRRLDELDLGEVIMGTASSQTPGLEYYWKMDEEIGIASFDLLHRNKLYFCGTTFDLDRPKVRTMGKTNDVGQYRIEAASYGTGTTFVAEPMKDFYMYRALRFVRNEADYATLPDVALTPKATLEMWVYSAGPDGTQCLLSKKWPGNDFRLMLRQNGLANDVWFYLNGQEQNLGNLGLGYQHLAFTIDSSGTNRTVTAYKNGQPFGAPYTFAGVTGNWSEPGSNWVLGARPSGGGYADHFGGLIDELAVYDTTLSVARILDHFQAPRDMTEKGLRANFNLDEGNGNRLNNSGSVLLPFGANSGAEWSPFAARQATTPHKFAPDKRQLTLNPSITSVDKIDFTDISTVPVTGYVRYQNTDCFAKNVEILVNGAPFSPKILTDTTGKFTIEFDPGTTATLTPVFPDTATTAEADVPHVFTPGFWDVTNVNNPIAGIVFNDVTTRTVRGIVAGGSKAGCNKSIIKAPAGQGQGTVCVVKVRSTDGCFERQIVLDNQEGEYEFANLPPLESLTIAVVEHSDPDVKAAFQTAGGSTVNLSLKDTVINFIYIAPPEVEIASGLTPIGACSDIVLDKGENIQLEIKLKEVYVPIVDNMGMVLDDGVCYLDTADFKIINGLSDTELDTAMGQGKLRYKFKVGDPNPSPPYLKTLQLIGTSLAGRIGSLSTQVIVTGIRNKAATFTTVSPPQIPTIILRDPPGDASYAYLEKDTTVCKTTAMSFDFEVGGGGGVEGHLGGTLINLVAPAPPPTGVVGPIIETGPVFDINAEFQVTYQKIESNAFQTCLTVSSRLSTSASDKFIGADGDVYVGEAWNMIFGFADQVAYNTATCTPGVSTILNVEPDSFPTVFMYTQYQVENFVMRYLDSLMTNPDPAVTPAQKAAFATSKARWQEILARNAGLKEKARLKRNISFDAGIEYEYSETSDTTDSESVEELTNSEQSLTTHFGYQFNDFGVVGMAKFVSGTSDSDSDGSENARGITTGYVLADDNDGDAFSVDVAMDSAYNTPVFRLKAGQSSCPWEEGTANRDAPNLELGQGSQFTAVNVPADEPAVFKLSLGNLSATNEDRYYGLTANPASNPDGAIIRVNGQELNANTIPYNVPFGESIPVTLTVERGPVAYEYADLQVALVADCELEYRDYNFSVSEPNDAKFISLLNLGVDFIRPCSEVAVSVPEQNWVVLNNDPIQPGTIRRITVSGYDLNSTDFQLVRVQYRRSDGDGAWINIPSPGGVFERYNPNWSGFSTLTPAQKANTLGPDFTNFSWETLDIGDGPYEIHAWAVCTGDASDKPGYSDIIKGRIDREPPSLVGVPQPSDGVYQVGDEISFTFNQHIDCKRLNPVTDVRLFDATTDEPIDIDITCFENKIVLTPTAAFQNKFFENRILRAELKGIEDLVGNVFNGTKFNKGIWEFYVDRNELGWLTDSVGLTKYEDETKTVTANIHNRGGYNTPFSILNVPDWVQVVPNQGTLVPNETRPISFTVDSTVAFGHWSDSIVLRTETGQNPFFMGGDERLPVGARVVCRPPYLPVNLSQYENTMSMVLKLNIEGVFSADAEDIVAAYINDEFRGKANVQYVPQVNIWLAYLTIYGNPADLLKPIRLEVWDASMCQRYSSVIEPFTYQPDNVIGITDNPQVVHTNGLLVREIPITQGWNWLSFNLAFPDNSLNAALASLKHPAGNLIRSQTAFSEYNSGWLGGLAQLNNTSMYMYRANVPDTLRMQGTPIDPATTPIPVAAGWNWIGYVPDYSLPVNEALASVPATYGDVVKSQYAFAQYLNPTFGWVGNLKYMMPPNGYQLKLAQAGTLTYPPPPAPFVGESVASRGDETDIHHASFITPHSNWALAPAQFEHSSTLIGMLRSNGANVTTSNMELGAFAGGEVRGTAQAMYIEPLDAHLFFMTMYANTTGEPVHFKLYDNATGTVRDLTETLYFAPNQHSGDIENPVPFELQTTGTGAKIATAFEFDIQPNPFQSETNFRFVLPKDEAVTLTISDASGRELTALLTNARAGLNAFAWDGRSDTGEWLSSGVYLVRLKTATGSATRKVVLHRLP
ncbi:MAG: choice-of-anchor D domain-containing protein, partial [Saprospiraceae bacterium]|nr:choice-of-anchor D domain-containing protein [Saprospiraceae bacterium]